MSKYQVFALAVLLLATLAFAQEKKAAIRRNLQDECATTQVTLSEDAEEPCLRCGTAGTFTRTKKNATACNCNLSSLTWSNLGYCDCGENKALLVIRGRPTCITCDEKVNAIGKADNISCTCIGDLEWNSTLKRCDCTDPEVFTGDACLSCDEQVNAIGVSTKYPGQCECPKDMKWDTKQLLCVCSNKNAVLFADDQGVVTCKACGPTINSLTSRISETQCECQAGLIWTENVGCTCANEGQVLIPGAKPRCVNCQADGVFSLGASDDGKSCTCAFEGLKWSPKTGKCACPKLTQVPLLDAQICFECKNSTALTNTAVNGTECTCINKMLKWDAESLACKCPELDTQVFVKSPTAACIECDDKVNAEGIDLQNGKCQCLGQLLFIDGRCSCGKTSAILKDSDGVISGLCVSCNNATRYLKDRKNETTCNCITTALKWDGVKGLCSCPDSKVPYGKGSALKCITCKGANIVGPNDPEDDDLDQNKCACPSQDFTFSISTKGVPSCTCAKNSIVTLAQECLACPTSADGGLGVIFNAHECKCAPTFFWSYKENECQKCTDVDQAKMSGGNNVACVCNTEFVWDVSTQTCIEPCTDGAACLVCTEIENSDGEDAVLATSKPIQSRINVAGATNIKPLLTNTSIPTNYNLLSKYQCGCEDGFLWDPIHFKCVPQNLN